MKMKLLFYCQHVLGMGHLVRSRELVKAMKDLDVRFINGGEPVEGFDFPPHVVIEQLPPIASDANFRALDATWETFERRKLTLRGLLSSFEPDVLMIEMFPFGRRKFAEELLPLLEANRQRSHPARVVCSVRDILVSKRDQERQEEFACRTLNEYFDLVLVHSDPAFQSLDESFGRVADLHVPIVHTGFVAEVAPERSPRIASAVPRIVASVGGGRVGFELLNAVIAASRGLEAPHTLAVFAGPHQPEEQYAELLRAAKDVPWIRVERFASDFVRQMASADLAINMAGYNTCMNLLTTGRNALVFPFTGNGNQEQTIRALKLERLGLLHVLQPEDLEPARLAHLIRLALSEAPRRSSQLNLNGAQNSLVAVERCLGAIHV